MDFCTVRTHWNDTIRVQRDFPEKVSCGITLRVLKYWRRILMIEYLEYSSTVLGFVATYSSTSTLTQVLVL
jgi:hypothetical protein